MVAASPSRRWYQFGLRTLIVLTTLCALALGWLAREWQFVRDRRAFDAAARASGGGYAFSARDSIAANWPEPMRKGEYETRWPPEVPPWRRWLGDEPFGLVMVPDDWSESRAADVARLFPEGFVFWHRKRVER